MRTKIAFTIVLGGLLAMWLSLSLPAAAGPGPNVLVQESLRGSMQGQAAIALDLDGDGYEDLIVGAPYAQGKGALGKLLVYFGGAAGLPGRPSLSLNGDGNFGWSLVSLGDVDHDGKPCFAAGAFNGSAKSGASLAGTVTIYKGGTQPGIVAVLSGENAMDRFGYALAAGDVNGDGIPDLIVGAPFQSPSAALYQKGAVYVYFGPDYKTFVKIPATPANGGLGFAVAAGDINNDGVDDLLLQASGKVIGLYGAKGTFAPAPAGPDVVFTSADTGFGKSIAVLPDLNGDYLKDIAVGADPASIGGVANSGRLAILKGGVGKRAVNVDLPGPDVLARIDGEATGGRFGSPILPLANGLAVSAVHAEGNPWPATGKIFIFPYSNLTAGASVVTAQSLPGNAPNLHLGASLASLASQSRLAAGAPMANANTGGVRLFTLP